MKVKDANFIAFSDSTFIGGNEIPNTLMEFTKRFLAKIKKTNMDGDNLGRNQYIGKLVGAFNDTLLYTDWEVQYLLEEIQHSNKKIYIKPVSDYDMESEAEFDVKGSVFSFSEERFKDFRIFFIKFEELKMIVNYYFLTENMMVSLYPTEYFYANENRTDGSYFHEGKQPKGYEKCNPSEMLEHYD